MRKIMLVLGITPILSAKSHALGYSEISASELISFRIHGVDRAFIEQAQQERGGDIFPKDLIRLKIQG